MAISLSEKKRKKKQWYSIVAPKQFQNIKLGEIQASAPDDLVGRILKANLMTLTNDPKKQSVTLSFKLKEVTNATCETDLVTYAINNAHIKRLVRKASNKLEESFLVKTKDGITFRIKPIILTRYKANKSVLTALRKKTREIIQQFVSTIESKDVFSQIISHRLQMETKQGLKKLYPVALCEIKSFTLAPARPQAI